MKFAYLNEVIPQLALSSSVVFYRDLDTVYISLAIELAFSMVYVLGVWSDNVFADLFPKVVTLWSNCVYSYMLLFFTKKEVRILAGYYALTFCSISDVIRLHSATFSMDLGLVAKHISFKCLKR